MVPGAYSSSMPEPTSSRIPQRSSSGKSLRLHLDSLEFDMMK